MDPLSTESKDVVLEELQHPIFTKDPQLWMSLVHKEVLVTVETGSQHMGWVYTVDPVSESIVLVNFSDGKTQFEVVMGHAVKEVRVTNESTTERRAELDNLCKSTANMPSDMSEEMIKGRQMSLKSWLLKNRLPVTVTGERSEMLTIADVLVIQPPYGPENCISTNEIILGRIQGLIKNMPPDHEQW